MKRLLIISLVLILSAFSLEDRAEGQSKTACVPLILVKKTFNIDSAIVDTLTSHGYSKRHALYWVKVARMESNKYTSVLYTYHNNPWGMSFFKSGRRPTNALYRVYHKGKPTRFAGYKSRCHAVQEIVYYLEAANYPKDFKSLDEFILFMKKKNYFEEPLPYYKKALTAI